MGISQGNSNRSNVGDLIRQARKRAGLTQACLAKTLGLSTGQSISNIERGVVPLPKVYFRLISEVLGIDRNEFVNRMLELERARLLGGGN